MKNTFLTALLALGIGLMPGFGLNFMSGNSVEWGHEDADQNPSKTVEMKEPTTQVLTAPKSHTALNQTTHTIHKSRVASADTSTVK